MFTRDHDQALSSPAFAVALSARPRADLEREVRRPALFLRRERATAAQQ
jgi:hypothetical protein